MIVYKICLESEPKNCYLEEYFTNIKAMIQELNPGEDGYIISAVEISDEEYEKLPEFMGF